MPHAYIFHGPEGVGKETLATAVAQLLLCPTPITRELGPADAEQVGADRLRDACGRCEDCRLVAAGTHPDLHLIYRQLIREHPESDVRARKGLELGVDVIRHFVIDKIGLTPSRGRAKAFIVREAELLNQAAQNAFLKTLEEPPGPSYIILLTTALNELLPTTLSRCQVVRFGALPDAFVRERLAAQRKALPKVELEWYAKVAGGSIGRALRFADEGVFALNRQIVEALAKVSRAAGSLADSWLELAKGLGERYRKQDRDLTDTEATRRALRLVLLLAANWYADVLRLWAGEADSLVNTPWHDALAAVARSADAERTTDLVKRIAAAEHELDQNANVQLCLEVLAGDLAKSADRHPGGAASSPPGARG